MTLEQQVEKIKEIYKNYKKPEEIIKGSQADKKHQEELEKLKEKLNKEKWGKNNHDITIYIEKENVVVTEKGYTVEKTKECKNLSRMINETAKILKQQTAQEKLNLLKEMIK